MTNSRSNYKLQAKTLDFQSNRSMRSRSFSSGWGKEGDTLLCVGGTGTFLKSLTQQEAPSYRDYSKKKKKSSENTCNIIMLHFDSPTLCDNLLVINVVKVENTADFMINLRHVTYHMTPLFITAFCIAG